MNRAPRRLHALLWRTRPKVAAQAAAWLGAALAAAPAWPATISGELNLAVVRYRVDRSDGAARDFSSLDSYTSRLAIRGGEDLGAGLRADFLIGSGFRADDGRGDFCNRECWVRLRGALGSIRLGRTLPIYDDISLAWYFIDSAGNHNPLALWANCGSNAGWKEGCFDNYQPNSLRYDSPNSSGFGFSASVSNPLQGSPDEAKTRVYDVGGEYQAGPVYFGLARQVNHGVRNPGLNDTATTLAVAWKGDLTVAAGYEHVRYAVASGGTLWRDYLGLLASYATGRQTVWANYGVAGGGKGSAADGEAVNAVQKLAASGAAMWTLGYQYKVSGGLKFYAFLNRIVNARNGIYSFDPRLTSFADRGGRLSALAFGVQRRF